MSSIVKLIGLTAATNEIIKTPEELIIFIARGSSGKTDEEKLKDIVKLVRYLIKQKHWSPFEMASMIVEIKTSRAIAAQILRHRSFSFQEFSQRYAEAENAVPVELRMQAEKNRQSSTDIADDPLHKIRVNDAIEHSFSIYKALINDGVAKECARMVLPLCTETALYMHGTIRSWIHYFDNRCDNHAQKEHRLVANDIREIFINEFPIISEALSYAK